MPKALITGITGQDGFFLAEWLLSKGYEVIGFARHNKPGNNKPLDSRVQLFFGDILNKSDISTVIQETMPDEIYNLASQSRPSESWAHAPNTLSINGLGAIRLFETVRTCCPKTKVYHASSSEMFGQPETSPQNEDTPFFPTNPYAASKLYAHHMARIYRESYGLFISSGILFNHESERRPLYYVTQKIAYGAACAALGIINSPDKNEKGAPIVSHGKLALGNLEIARDWGYAPDFVRAMWLMLQQEKPDDFIIGTGKLHTLKELCDVAYRYVDKNWQDHIISDPSLIRPLEASQSVANSQKAQQQLSWKPSIGFHEMITKMVDAQIKQLAMRETTSTALSAS